MTTLAAPQPANKPITITAAATGGANVQYQFWVYNPSAIPAWTQLRSYTPNQKCVWTPMAAGPYLISVTALDGATGVAVNKLFWCSIG